jgi:DNA-binding transcriptional MerR regulator
MGLIPIGEAAARLQMTTSALRYYDERKLVCPRQRQGGRRMYGPDELRRLALIKIFNQLGVSLDTAAAVLDAPSPQWRETVRAQIAQLDEVIAQARGAQAFLEHALGCTTDHPVRECRTMTGALDRLVDGMTVDQLGAEYADDPRPSSRV